MQSKDKRTFREEARLAKSRIKSGFWNTCKENMDKQLALAREQGVNETKAGMYFKTQETNKIAGRKEDEFVSIFFQ